MRIAREIAWLRLYYESTTERTEQDRRPGYSNNNRHLKCAIMPSYKDSCPSSVYYTMSTGATTGEDTNEATPGSRI